MRIHNTQIVPSANRIITNESNIAINEELKRIANEKHNIDELTKLNTAKDILQQRITKQREENDNKQRAEISARKQRSIEKKRIEEAKLEYSRFKKEESLRQMEQQRILDALKAKEMEKEEEEALRLEEEYQRIQMEKELADKKKAQVKRMAADIAAKECETAHEEYLQAKEYQESIQKSIQAMKQEIATCKITLQSCSKEIEELHKVKQTAERIVVSKKDDESKIFEERRVLTGLVEDARVKALKSKQFEKVRQETNHLLADIIQKEQRITAQKNIAQDTISDIIQQLEIIATKIQSTTSERITAEGTYKSLSEEFQLATKETKSKEKIYMTTQSAANDLLKDIEVDELLRKNKMEKEKDRLERKRLGAAKKAEAKKQKLLLKQKQEQSQAGKNAVLDDRIYTTRTQQQKQQFPPHQPQKPKTSLKEFIRRSEQNMKGTNAIHDKSDSNVTSAGNQAQKQNLKEFINRSENTEQEEAVVKNLHTDTPKKKEQVTKTKEQEAIEQKIESFKTKELSLIAEIKNLDKVRSETENTYAQNLALEKKLEKDLKALNSMLQDVATSKNNNNDLSQEESERLDMVLSRTESLLDDKIKKRDTSKKHIHENELLLQNIQSQLEQASSGAKIAGERLAAEKEKYSSLDENKKVGNDTASTKSSLPSFESNSDLEKKVVDIDSNLGENIKEGQIGAIDTSTTSTATNSEVDGGDSSSDNMIHNEIESDEEKAAYEARLKANQLTADDQMKVDRVVVQRIADAKNAFAARYNIKSTIPSSSNENNVAARNEGRKKAIDNNKGDDKSTTTFADKNLKAVKGKGWGVEKQNLDAVKGKNWEMEKQQDEMKNLSL